MDSTEGNGGVVMTSRHLNWSTIALYICLTLFCVSFWMALVIVAWSWA